MKITKARSRWLHSQLAEAVMRASFDRFELRITKTDAFIGSHSGRCDEDILYLRDIPYIRRQLEQLDPAELAEELREYGAWEEEELANHGANLDRILWIACGNIAEECGK